jgi:protein SCO1
MTFRASLGLALVVIFASTSGTAATPRETERQLKRAKVSAFDLKLPAPIRLVRDDGKTVALASELDRTRPVVVDFIFTRCTTICPVMSRTFAQLQGKLGTQRDNVQMVSISLDPEYDTPERLADYAKRLKAGPRWHFYSGTVDAVVAAQRAFESFRGDKMDHTPVTFVRPGAAGTQWERIDGFASADELVAELRR